MIAYRKKTRSDEQVDPSLFRVGRTVWEGPEGAREVRFCVGPNQRPLTLEQFREWKKDRAEANRKNNPYRKEPRRSLVGTFVGVGLGGCW